MAKEVEQKGVGLILSFNIPRFALIPKIQSTNNVASDIYKSSTYGIKEYSFATWYELRRDRKTVLPSSTETQVPHEPWKSSHRRALLACLVDTLSAQGNWLWLQNHNNKFLLAWLCSFGSAAVLCLIKVPHKKYLVIPCPSWLFIKMILWKILDKVWPALDNPMSYAPKVNFQFCSNIP